MTYEKEGIVMTTIVGEIVMSLAKAAEGATLAATVYLVNRGVKHPLHRRRK